MATPSGAVRAELAGALRTYQKRLGEVFVRTERGMSPAEIASDLGVGSSGFVSNNRIIARALLDGEIPRGETMVRQGRQQIVRFRALSRLSRDADAYIRDLLQALGQPDIQVSHRSSPRRAALGPEPRTETHRPATPLPKPSESIVGELRRVLRDDQTRLGDVFRLTQRGLNPDQIAGELGVSTSGFVSNYRICATTLLTGVRPSAGIARQTAGSARSLAKLTGMMSETRQYLVQLAAALDGRALPRAEASTVGTGVAVADVVRRVVSRIAVQTDLDALEYRELTVVPEAEACLRRLIVAGSASHTFLELRALGRLDLSLEAELVRLSDQFELEPVVVSTGRARLAYYGYFD